MSALDAVLFAVVQAATEFLPVSSSGHLALLAHFISEPDIFFFTVLHAASLLAIVIFIRKELASLILFKKETRIMWLYLAIATLPAALFGILFKPKIEASFSSIAFIGCAFLFTGAVLFFTKFTKPGRSLNAKNAAMIGLFQALALFPGVSRSGMTISSGLFCGMEREKAAKFSFLLFIPTSLGALLIEGSGKFYLNNAIVISFLICFVLSLLFLNLLYAVVKRGKLWLFSAYCFLIGLISIFLGV